MRLLLACLLTSIGLAAQAASPTIDGTSPVGNVGAPGATSTTLTTSLTNDVIVACTTTHDGASSTIASVTGVSDTAGLSWTKRFAGSRASGAANTDTECWWAFSAGTLSGDTITFSYTTAPVGSVVSAFGVNGAALSNPWDCSGTLPAVATFASNTTPSNTITTKNPSDLLLVVIGDGGANLTEMTSVPAGWTALAHQICVVCGQIGEGYLSVSAVQTGVTVTWGAATTGAPLIYVLDALTATAGPFCAGGGTGVIQHAPLAHW